MRTVRVAYYYNVECYYESLSEEKESGLVSYTHLKESKIKLLNENP